MTKYKFQNLIRPWLFKAVLVFSVFSFSGFNVHIHAAIKGSVKTELAESRTCKPSYSLKKKTNKHSIGHLSSQPLGAWSYNYWDLLNHSRVLEIRFNSYRNRILLNKLTSIKSIFKFLPSSSIDEPRPFSFG